MNLKKTGWVLFAVLFLASSALAVEMGGINMPGTLKAGGTDLVLNGGGTRTKFFIKAYVAGLYLKQKGHDAGLIISADEPMAVRLQITSGLVDSEKMESAVREGFEKSTNGDITPIKRKIEGFINIFKSPIKENDVYEFFYVPGSGTEVYKNGVKSAVIGGLEFKKALFGIWLCNKPAQADLKEKMLGNK
jgi:hypothetical protein